MSMEENKEWIEYIQRLKAQVRGMDDIMSMAGSSYGLIDENMISGINGADGIRELREKAAKLCRKLETREFEIAIVGLEKAGKSTFANAMMMNDILPSKPARCTYTATSIRYGESNHAEVVFYSHEEFERNFRENLGIMGIEHAVSLSYRTLSEKEYQEMFDKLSDEKKRLYGTTIHEDVLAILKNSQNLIKYIGSSRKTFHGEELTSEMFKNFIENPAYAIAVKEITIHSEKFENMPHAVIYDVPGFDSPTQMHKEQTKARMNSADVIVLVAGADRPSLTGPQLDIFDREADDDGIRFNEKIFVFANRADIAVTLDKAVTLAENISKLKEELRKYRIVDPTYLDKRVVPGSAKAKLFSDEAVMEILKSAGIDDGVDKMISLLNQYYDNERFEAMKKRVNTIQSQIQNMFEKVFERQQVTVTGNEDYLSRELFADLYRNAINSIRPALDAYKAELTQKYSFPNLPITQKLKDDVIAKITPEVYGVTDEEMVRARNAKLTNNGISVMSEVEAELRCAKYRRMFDDFVNHVVALSADEHKECNNRIISIFLDGLGITQSNMNYDRLRKSVEELVNSQKESEGNAGYYRSLVERFSSDLFEILIRLSLGDLARWHYFEDELSNFYSLAMFDVNRNIYLPIDRQPLYYAILFQDRKYADMQKYVDDTLHEIMTFLDVKEADEELMTAAKRYAFAKLDKAAEEIRTKYSDRNRGRDSLLRRINNELEDLQTEGSLEGSEKIDIDFYQNFFKDKRDKDETELRTQIETDIEILQQVLHNVAVNAINIEKPFRFLETHMIEKMKAVLDSREFSTFLNMNIPLILAEQFRDIEEEENKRRIRRDICQKIKTILEQMKSADLVTV